ncbi:replicative DNA helicase [Mycoplasmoides pirum]|uniref:replicative DNA helicase n=1 Tax=Mycoplasmoides pirum TaxID=2122 RepID=UPI0004873220|nr:replicative DNA helicase [Mycoplasmoides pirum]
MDNEQIQNETMPYVEITPELGIESEENVLSLLINNSVSPDNVFAKLIVSDFSNPNYRLLFNTMLSMYESNKQIDLTIVKDNLQVQNHLSDDMRHLLNILATKNSNPIIIDNYIQLIRMASMLRELKKLSQDILDSHINFLEFDDQLAIFEHRFSNIIKSTNKNLVLPINNYVDKYKNKFEKSYFNTITTGTKTNFERIDELTNGFQPGDLIILAARPGRGKTAFSVNLIVNVAKNLEPDETVVMFSLEMGGEQIVHRIVSAESMINFNLAKVKNLDSQSSSQIVATLNKINDLPILIDDSSDISLTEIRSRLQQIANTKKIKLVVIDYLQLVKVTRTHSMMTRQQEVAMISHSLKSLARELEIPIIAIAQLSRKIEERRGASSQPILSDLRESGSIEQDADLVCFLHTVESDDEMNSLNQDNVDIEFIIAKHRNGATGKAELTFQKSISKFISKSNTYTKE